MKKMEDYESNINSDWGIFSDYTINNILNDEVELIEDEVDIDNIENINAYDLPENEEDFRQMSEFCRLQYHKNTEFIDALKQLNKEMKSIKEK